MLEKIISDRLQKLEELKKRGVDPYPVTSKRTSTIDAFLKDFKTHEKTKKTHTITGRIRALRDQGKIIFCVVEDETGRIQSVCKRDSIKDFDILKKLIDIGDFIQITGKPLITQRGEKSIECKSFTLLGKSLRPLPSDFYGLENTETRLRQRYLDTLLDPEVKKLFVRKAIFWRTIREFLEKEGFMAVETPILEATPGGAEAEPFVTHHNALDEDFYLRISLEISLKKMAVGGFEKIYEIGRIFRNEGIDAEHLQDYTQLEFYWAYSDYQKLMKMVRKMYLEIIKKTFGTYTLQFQNKKVQWNKPWKVVDYRKAFKDKNKLDILECSLEDLFKKAQELGLKPEKNLGRGRLIDLIYKKTVRPFLIEPSFLINPPETIEPLAKRSPKDPRIVERFQVVAYGTELGKGFSEANDPLDQRTRFEEQMKLREKGDGEAQMLDEDFLEALEYGMPPMAGFGMSERLFAVLAQKPIREIVFFPPMKRKK